MSSPPIQAAEPPHGETGIAKFSCDSCRQKKVGCTRELPKCQNCKQWPGLCTYTHVGQLRKKKGLASSSDDTLNASSTWSTQIPAADRLDRIEASIGSLQDAVQRLTDLLLHSGSSSEKPPTSISDQLINDPAEPLSNASHRQAPLHVFSAFPQARLDLEAVRSKAPSGYLNGSASLQQLSDDFSAIHFDTDNIREDVKKARRSRDQFYIPTWEDGHVLIREFKRILERGRPMFDLPADGLELQIAFEPSMVQERGWVLLFNCLTVSSSALDGPQYDVLKSKLRWNTWVALDDGSLFFEPSIINVQALVALAIHGEGFTTPSMSWTLTSHACRLAQTISLHAAPPPGQEGRTILFWALFAVDKSVSLAFGRPPMLPSHYYEGVPLPNLGVLAEYTPHIDRQQAPESAEASDFGACFFLQSVLLSKLSGDVIHYLHSLDALDKCTRRSTKSSLLAHLDQWHYETMAMLSNSRETELKTSNDESKSRELALGLTSLTFQFHHLRVVLTRNDEVDADSCLRSAREVVSLLPKLVSTSEDVYNGIVWQLLYHPFNAILVLFGNIIRAPMSETCSQDVLLLRSTISYYENMAFRGNGLASKLKNIAHAFYSLADFLFRDTQGLPASLSDHDTLGPSTFDFSVDSNLLYWITGPDFMAQNGTVEHQMTEPNEGALFPPAPGPVDKHLMPGAADRQSNMIRSLEKRGLKRPLECTFDWFSWDLYNER